MAKIIHVDMDCFYAAVEFKDRPELKGKPIAVGGSAQGRGVIAASSYEARRYGVRSAMATAKALRLCPDLILLPLNFERYRQESRIIQSIFYRFTDLVEPLSLDEAYLDVTNSPHCSGSATLIAREIRRLIQEETQLTASAGVAPNKMLAKVASDWNKPNGLKVIKPDDVKALMVQLPVEKLNGVGKVTAQKMASLGIHTCGDLQALSLNQLRHHFGSWGEKLHGYSRGIDLRNVQISKERKSLSVERTYARDLDNFEACNEKLTSLMTEWSSRMSQKNLDDFIRSAFVKIRFSDFSSTTHECQLTTVPDLEIFRSLLSSAISRKPLPIRLLGIGVRLSAKTIANKDEGQLAFQFD